MSAAKNTGLTVGAYFKSKSWSPYFIGAAIGILSWFAFWSADHPLGVTNAFVALYTQLTPLIESLGNEGKLTFPSVTSTSPWLWVAGLIVAASIAFAWSRGPKPKQSVHSQEWRVADSKQLRDSITG